MKTFLTIVFLFSFFSVELIAQHGHEHYDWPEQVTISSISEDEMSYPAVIIKDYKIVDFRLEGSSAKTYTTVHKVVHINTDAGIEKHNKVYIPMQANSKVLSLKVRSINSQGKVTLIQSDNIKELENVEGFKNVKIFAIEGLEVGGEAEYIYTVISDFNVFGKKVFQQDIPVKKAEIKILHPSKWIMTVRSYNGLPAAKKKTVNVNQTLIHLEAEEIQAFEKEEFAYEDPLLMRFEYKLSDNGYKSNLFTWKHLSERLVSNLTASNGSRAGNKLTKDIGDDLSKEDQIRALENKIKSSIRLVKGSNEVLSDPVAIIKSGAANSRGLAKLYIYSLLTLGIENELVYGCNRNDGSLDKTFATPSEITDLLIYFPQFDKYLSPESYHMRYGVPHIGLTDTEALFIIYTREYTLLKSSAHYFNTIKGLGPELNHQGKIVSLDFSENLSLPLVRLESYSQGYESFTSRSAYHYSNKSGQEDYIKFLTISAFENYDIKSMEVEGDDITLSAFPEEYFRVKMSYTTPELVERAGNEYLVSIGKVIGKQSELYQEKERQHDIAFSSIKNYHHEITINVPKGYTLEGLENIRINHNVRLKDKDVMYFSSDYIQTDSSLTITVDEVYSVLHLPKYKYPDFRNVINSAANFNKLTLVLKKEE